MSTVSQNILIVPVIATVLFCISKFVEMKFIDNDVKPIKVLFRDALIVFISSLTATYICFYFSDNIQDFINIITDTKTSASSILGGGGSSLSAVANTAEIFTDNPNF
jgi:hypothetical protein